MWCQLGLHAIQEGVLIQTCAKYIFSNAVYAALVGECARNGHCKHLIQYISLSKQQCFGVKGTVAVSFPSVAVCWESGASTVPCCLTAWGVSWTMWLQFSEESFSICRMRTLQSNQNLQVKGLTQELHVLCYSYSNTGDCSVRQPVHLKRISLSFTPTSPLKKLSNTLLT